MRYKGQDKCENESERYIETTIPEDFRGVEFTSVVSSGRMGSEMFKMIKIRLTPSQVAELVTELNFKLNNNLS